MNWQVIDNPTHPLENAKWVATIVHIRHNATGEVRQYPNNDAILDDGQSHPSTFIWEEGNYACDCNRRHFFESAAGIKTNWEELACGDGAYSVNLENPVTKEIYYREFHNPEHA